MHSMIRTTAVITVTSIGTIASGMTCVLAQQGAVNMNPLSEVLVQGGFAALCGILVWLLMRVVWAYRTDMKDLLTKYHEKVESNTVATVNQVAASAAQTVAMEKNTEAVDRQTAAAESWRRHLDRIKEEATTTAEVLQKSVESALVAAGHSCEERWKRHIEAVVEAAERAKKRELHEGTE